MKLDSTMTISMYKCKQHIIIWIYLLVHGIVRVSIVSKRRTFLFNYKPSHKKKCNVLQTWIWSWRHICNGLTKFLFSFPFFWIMPLYLSSIINLETLQSLKWNASRVDVCKWTLLFELIRLIAIYPIPNNIQGYHEVAWGNNLTILCLPKHWNIVMYDFIYTLIPYKLYIFISVLVDIKICYYSNSM